MSSKPTTEQAPKLPEPAPAVPASPRLPRGPHQLSRAEVAANQRLRLVLAMIDTIGEKGYAPATVVDVVARAGVSRKTFYQYFANKQECLLATYDVIVAEGMRRVATSYRQAKTWNERVEASVRVLFESTIENPAAARLAMVEIGAAGVAGIERRQRTIAEYEQFIRDGLELAPGSGTVPDTTLRAVVGGFNRVLYAHMRSRQHAKLRKLVPDLVGWATAYYPTPEVMLPSMRPDRHPGERALDIPIGGRAPGSLSPRALSSGRRGLPRGDNNVSRSFVVHSQRERILDAVANLSAALGYTTLTVEDIVTEAAVSLEAFYEHFESKEDSFLVAYELGHAKGLSLVEAAFAAEADWRRGIKAACRALLVYLASEPAFAHLALLDTLVATPISIDRSDKGLSGYAQMLLPGFEEAPKRRRPPQVAIEAITGGLFELFCQYTVQGRIRQLPELTADATYIALAPFIGTKQAARVALEPLD